MGASEGIDLATLQRWFPEHVAASRAPLKVSLISGGHSNLTYRVDDANGGIFALRRPPLGDIPRSAHDVLREHRVLAALKPTAVPVPSVEAVCSDLTVIGAPFYVMRWVDGRILDRLDALDEILPTSEARQRAAFGLIDGLADLHRLDVDVSGLGELGRREQYLARQLGRLRRVWDKTKTRDLPIIESLHSRLLARQPPQRYTGLVHADYRLGNLMLGADGRLAAVLDWELCALGDVLTDLGHLLDNWDEPADPWPNVWMEIAPTRAGGFPSREEMVARYAQKTGFEVANLDYYRAFGYWRIAVIAEGMKRRYESGAMASHAADSADLDWRVRERARLADYFLTRSGG
jgi:aminoglycoside phosphotransferase (APT) family kinase protein